MPDTIGSYGVTDFSSVYVVNVRGERAGVTTTFQLGLAPGGSGLATAGVASPLRNIDPPTGGLGVIGNRPTLVDPGHPT